MISMLLYSHDRRELKAFDSLGREVVSRVSDDDWDFLCYHDKKLVLDFLSKNPVIDLSCVDVADNGGVELAETLRRDNAEMYMILLTDATVSPVVYIRPTIMAGSLLMRPLSRDSVKSVFLEAFRQYLRKFEDNTGDSFLIDNRDGRQLIPYRKICFFESRDKKIYVNTGAKEYSFYDTLDNLEDKLPEGFLRCHRSFIVSRDYIKKILLSRNMIVLEDDSVVPLSRSYKSVFKEIK